MQRKLIFILFLFTILSFYSCNKDDIRGKGIPIKINIKYNEKLKYSEIIENIYYLPLETIKENRIANPSYLKIHKDRIYILDDSRYNALYVFDKKGKFKFKIHNPGRGPKETLSSNFFQIHKSKIYLYDMRARKFNIYDMEGEFLNKQYIPHRFYQFCFQRDDSLIAHVNNMEGTDTPTGFSLLFMTSNGNIHAKRLPINRKKEYAFMNPLNFVKYEESFTLLQPLNNVIYKIKDKNHITPKYLLDFGEYWAPEDFFDKHRRLSDFKKSNYVFFTKYFETTNHLFLNFQLNNSWRQAIYCKSTGKVKIAYEAIDDICSSLSYNKMVKGKHENKLIFLFYPEKINTLIKQHENKNIKKNYLQNENYMALKKINKALNRGDNPVLAFVTLKEF